MEITKEGGWPGRLWAEQWKPGRGERIRTSGLYVPNVALYQAKLHPVWYPLDQPNAKASVVAVNRESA
jgi:hypothetical protein